MTDLQNVFDQAPKAIVHLRAQLLRNRLGLIFGAGASRDLKFPDWKTLVERISAHSDVDAESFIVRCKTETSGGQSITRSLASITQALFSQFRQKCIINQSLVPPLTFIEEQKIKTTWLHIIHDELYKDMAPQDRDMAADGHKYLKDFLEIIKRSSLTVNYNFDDTLERLLLRNREGDEVDETRGYEVTDRPNLQFQKNTRVIYHPNGYLPSTFEDGASAEVVFSDDAFQDQLISAANGRYVHLSTHLFRNTCLLIGLSLEDATLQSLLRQNAVNNPGNVHYIVHFHSRQAGLDNDIRDTIFRSNFESYNLYTLFLDSEGISALSKLVSMPVKKFKLNFEQNKPKFVYYIVGSVGAGKSTAAANFRNLITYDEWIDERKPELARPEIDVPQAKEEMNDWIAQQFRKKNFALANQSEGIHLVDRCPLDPLTFGTPEERPSKASALISTITNKNARKIENGHVIYLDCDLDQIRIRNSFKHKYWPDSEYLKLINNIKSVYGGISGLSTICTRGRTAASVAHEIAKVIFLDQYRPIDIETELEKFIKPSKALESS